MDNLSLAIHNGPDLIQVRITGNIVNTHAWCLKQTLLELVKPLQILILDLTEMEDICLQGLNALKSIKMNLQLQNSDFTILANTDCKLFEFIDVNNMTPDFKIIKRTPQVIAH